MRPFQFNIAGLLVSIFILGVGFAALRESSDLRESVLSLIAGILAGQLARHLYARTRESATV